MPLFVHDEESDLAISLVFGRNRTTAKKEMVGEATQFWAAESKRCRMQMCNHREREGEKKKEMKI